MGADMRLRSSLWPVLLAAFFVAACGDANPDRDSASEAAPGSPAAGAAGDDGTGLRPPATFRGLMPCADCPGILATLELEADGSGRLSYLYMEGEVDSDPTFVEEGRWAVDDQGRLTFQPTGTGVASLYQIGDDGASS